MLIITGCGGGGSTSSPSTGTETPTTPADTEAPTAPMDLTASAVSDSSISLSWDASTDNGGVTEYKIYRDSVEVATTSNLIYPDTELVPGTLYSYSISATDAAGNESVPAVSVSAKTLTYYYIRSDAVGLNNGSDWENAFSGIPDDLVRGSNYYIAAGNYGIYNFDDPEIGEEWIKIIKATESDHGTETGWNLVNKTGVVVFNGLNFKNGYYEINGATGGGPDNWKDGFGIHVQFVEGNAWPLDTKMVTFQGNLQPTNIRFLHIDFEHIGIDWEPTGDIFYVSCLVYEADQGASDIYIGYSYLHDCSRNQILTSRSERWVVEYNLIARNKSTLRHAEGWQDFGSNNMIVRYNYWEDIQGSGFISFKKNSGGELQSIALHNYNWKIYGNVMYHTFGYDDGSYENIIGGQGVIGAVGPNEDAEHGDIYIFNNTIFNIYGHNCGFFFDTGLPGEILAYNNLFLNNHAKSVNLGLTNDYNHYVNHTFSWNSAPNIHDSVTEIDPTVHSDNYDLRLAVPSLPGITLSDEYSYDMFGNKRGADGHWDRGAFEFISESTGN